MYAPAKLETPLLNIGIYGIFIFTWLGDHFYIGYIRSVCEIAS